MGFGVQRLDVRNTHRLSYVADTREMASVLRPESHVSHSGDSPFCLSGLRGHTAWNLGISLCMTSTVLICRHSYVQQDREDVYGYGVKAVKH